MLPLVACMCVSTVWGRYHYVADIFGGVVTGTLGYVIGGWLLRSRDAMKLRQASARAAGSAPCIAL
jgi:membrane-associated phospholipid phosphatase